MASGFLATLVGSDHICSRQFKSYHSKLVGLGPKIPLGKILIAVEHRSLFRFFPFNVKHLPFVV
jgi:hypothetical protein